MVCDLGLYQVRPADLSETRPAMALMAAGWRLACQALPTEDLVISP